MAGTELQSELKNKLLEEVEEVKDADNQEEVAVEIADVLEVVDALCKAYNIDENKIQHIKQKKREQRGGFEKGFYVEYIEVPEGHPKVEHFRSSPDRYPEGE